MAGRKMGGTAEKISSLVFLNRGFFYAHELCPNRNASEMGGRPVKKNDAMPAKAAEHGLRVRAEMQKWR